MITSNYMLRRFEGARDRDFIRAINIYKKFVHPSIKTNINEIVYWIDNYNRTFKDNFYVLGFYASGKLVGYSEFAYLKEDRLIIFDYIVIDERYRKNNIFFEFVEHLKVFIDNEKLDFNYAVAEVGYLTKQKKPSEYSQKLVKLLKLAGGKVIKAPYYQPKLGLYNYDSEMQAVLMMFSYSEIEEISRETYLAIVNAIYSKYYLRWYSIYQESIEDYKQEIEKLSEKIKEETSKMIGIKLNGFKPTGDDAPSHETIVEQKLFKFIIPSLAFVILLAFLMFKLQEMFQLSLFTLIIVYLISLVSFFSLLAVFSPTAMIIFTKLLSFIKPFSRKLK